MDPAPPSPCNAVPHGLAFFPSSLEKCRSKEIMLPLWEFPGTPRTYLTKSPQEMMSTFGFLPYAIYISQETRAAIFQGQLTALWGLLYKRISSPVGQFKKSTALIHVGISNILHFQSWSLNKGIDLNTLWKGCLCIQTWIFIWQALKYLQCLKES